MARRSSAALAAEMFAGEIARPQPPRELTPAESDEWNSIVGRMPADWFTAENQPLLGISTALML